jgi:outer membrane protein OmpU
VRPRNRLMGTTALASAGLLISAGAEAQETDVGGLEVVLGGYTEFGISAASRDTLVDVPNRNYTFFMDNLLFIYADAATESGIFYGSKIELEVGSGDGTTVDPEVDEVGLYLSGDFGRIELGQDDGAEDVMGIGGEDAQAGTGGIDGDTANLITFEITDTDDSNKATYFTPRLAGFQLGASFVPDDGFAEDAIADDVGDQENIVGLGGNWVSEFELVDVTLASTGIVGHNEGGGDTNDDLRSWEVGTLLDFVDVSVGIKYGQETDLDKGQFFNAGIAYYGFESGNVSVGYVLFDPQGDTPGDTNNLFAISGDLDLLPGVTLKGDVTYATEDPEAHLDEDDPDDTIAGVLTVQLDY